MPKLELEPQFRSELRAAAHPLKPVVLVGDKGLSDAVLAEIDRALKAHGLIKIRVTGHERDEREAMLERLCDTLDCAPVHHLGKILIVYRPRRDDPQGQAFRRVPRDPVSTLGIQPRKADEPYIPKKLAATKVGGAAQRPKRSGERVPRTGSTGTAARERRAVAGAGRQARGAVETGTAVRRARTVRSALSLRAGVRAPMAKARTRRGVGRSR